MIKSIHKALLLAGLLTGALLTFCQAEAAAAYTAKVYASSLTVRSEPAAGASAVGFIKNGTTVTVTDEQHGWMKVRSGSVTGWVAGYYLKKVDGGSASTAAGSSVSTVKASSGSSSATVTADSLRIRGGQEPAMPWSDR